MAQEEKRRKNRVGYMIFSVIAAIVVWVMVAYMTDPDVSKTLHGLNVRFVGEDLLRDRGYIVTNIDELPDLSVKVSGKRSDMLDAIDNIVVEVDVSNIDSIGEYDLEGTVVLANSRIYLEKIKFSSVPVTIDEYEEKDIPIEVKQIGTIKNKMVKSESSTKTVRISGAKGEVDKVAAGTATVDLEKVKETGEMRLNFVMVDSGGALIGKNETIETATPNIIVKNTVYDVAELPIKAELGDSLKDKYILDEEKTEITPSVLTVGVLPETSFENVKVIINSVSENEAEYMAVQEEGMYIPENERKVTVKAEIYSSEQFSKSVNISVLNLGEGLKATGELMLNAEFYGTDSDDITACVDASGLSAGVYELPVSFKGGDVCPVGEYTAEIIIIK